MYGVDVTRALGMGDAMGNVTWQDDSEGAGSVLTASGNGDSLAMGMASHDSEAGQ